MNRLFKYSLFIILLFQCSFFAFGSTPFRFADTSGRFKVSSDTINGKNVKVIECTTAGLLYLPITALGQMTPTESAYGTWEWWLSKDNASTFDVAFVALNKNISTGYGINISAAEVVTLQEYGVGAVAGISGSISADTWTKVRVTRSGAGLFNVYLDGISIGSGTDSTTTSCEYFVLDMDAGDKFAYSDVTGDHSFFKALGVVSS